MRQTNRFKNVYIEKKKNNVEKNGIFSNKINDSTEMKKHIHSQEMNKSFIIALL